MLLVFPIILKIKLVNDVFISLAIAQYVSSIILSDKQGTEMCI